LAHGLFWKWCGAFAEVRLALLEAEPFLDHVIPKERID
jgi:hypothetical protein